MQMKKWLSLLLAAALAVACLPGAALAAEEVTNLNQAGNWVSDRTEPQNFTISGGKIHFGVAEQPGADSWYGWQGRKAYTGVKPAAYWKVGYTFEITQSMLEQENVNVSLWLQVDKEGANTPQSQKDCVDWSIIQFLNTGTPKWQAWDSNGSGSWKDISGVSVQEGTYTVETVFSNGTITQYMNGSRVNSYSVGAAKTAPVSVIAQGRSYGAAFAVSLGVPVVESALASASVDSQEALLDAISRADSGATITLEGNITLTRKLVLDKSITIDGNGFTITGQPDNKEVCIEVQSGTFGLRNVTLENFGSNVTGTNGDAVIRVPAAASASAALNAVNVNIRNFARSAYDIRSGSFAISGGSISCGNTVAGDSNTKLTKGILAGLGTNRVKGTISGVTITNAVSNYADWNTAAIEIYNNAEVNIKGCTIRSMKNGIHVDNYWGAAGQDVSVTISGTQVDVTGDAVKLYSTYADQGGVANANVLVESGVFNGAVRYVGKTQKDTISVTGGTFSADPTQFLPEGYAVRQSDGGYVVYQVVDTDTPVEVEPEEDGSAVVSEEAMNDAISSAVAGENPQVTIQVGGDPEAQSVSVCIPTGSLDALAAQENASLTITAPAGQVTFDQDALNTIAQEAAGQNVTLQLEPADGLTQAQQNIIGDNVAIDLTLWQGDILISQFNGEVTVTVPFTLAGDKTHGDVEVYYVGENGQLSKCDSSYADGKVAFITRHFSTYMVTYAGEIPEQTVPPATEETVPPTTEETVPPTTEDTVPPTTDGTEEPTTEAPTTEGTRDPNGPAQTGETTPVALLLVLMFTGVAGVAISLVCSGKRRV